MEDKKKLKSSSGIEVLDGDIDSMLKAINNWGNVGQSLYPTLKFSKKGFYIIMWDQKKEVKELKDVRVLFRTQKFELIDMEDPKHPKTVAYSSEYFWLRRAPWYVYKKDEPSILANNISEAKTIIEKLRVADYRKQFYNVLYIDTPEWIMRMYLRYTQVGGQGWLSNPDKGTAKSIIEAPWYYKKLYTISMDSYISEAGMNVYFPRFKETAENPDKDIFKKIQEITEKIISNEQKNFVAPEEWKEATIVKEDDDLPF